MRLIPSGLLAIGLVACAAPQTGAPATQPDGVRTETGEASAGSSGDSSTSAPGVTSEAKESPHPLLDDRSADPAHALPRLSIKHLGLHVGGGTGSAEERSALLQALEKGQRGLLACYRLVDRPGAGGTFGADLHVAARGGHPEIRALRHKLGGPGFEACMVGALADVAFGPQARPIVVSYSLRFEMSP